MKPAAAATDNGEDLIDRNANALPVEVRAAYYRELNHCRSLQENDELLRILRAMQFLALLMNQVPERVLVEREKLEGLFSTALGRLEKAVENTETFHRQLEQRLTELPKEVARGLSPPAIAQEVTKSLRQQFVQSTIPETADALRVVAAQLITVSGEFARAAREIGDAHHGAASDARRAICDLDSTVSRATNTARSAAAELSSVFQREFRLSVYTLCACALVIGMSIGAVFIGWVDSPVHAPSASTTPAVQSTPPARAKSR